ncbi:patatin-like phospholipase family protein [Calothrix membranacea FACHB-236]|nr:patatin-like phospholipase family protein [Calothrix membranacea FACHB-236]
MVYKIKVLSIDGGGIRGIIPAILLARIEEITEKPISELFDLIAGTSTGGILALGLTCLDADNPGKPYTAERLINIYKEEGEIIFSRRKFFNKLSLPKTQDFFRSKYTSQKRKELLQKYFSESNMQNALKEVFVTSYDTKSRTPIFFTSDIRKEIKTENYQKICRGCKMYDAAMATSAAPTFFKPHQLSIPIHKREYTLIDGGMLANNPTSLAIVEAMVSHNIRTNGEERLSLDDILVVSLGTGLQVREYEYEEISQWGIVQWAQPFINMTLNSQSEVVDCQLEQLLSLSRANLQAKQYYRFQPSFSKVLEYNPTPQEDMDDTSRKNIANLEALANNLIAVIDDDLKNLSEQLLK